MIKESMVSLISQNIMHSGEVSDGSKSSSSEDITD